VHDCSCLVWLGMSVGRPALVLCCGLTCYARLAESEAEVGGGGLFAGSNWRGRCDPVCQAFSESEVVD
jgi:hypothetical protein